MNMFEWSQYQRFDKGLILLILINIVMKDEYA